MPEISLAEAAPGEATSKLDPRTKLLALLVLNALVMRASPTSTLGASSAMRAVSGRLSSLRGLRVWAHRVASFS